MRTMAILVDGGFYLKRAKHMRGQASPEERADELHRYCMSHLHQAAAHVLC